MPAVPEGENKDEPAGLLSQARRFILQDLWNLDVRPRSLKAAALAFVQLVVMIARGFVRDRLLLRASALTYVTSLALIPMLAVMVGLMRLGDGGDRLVSMLVEQLTVVSPDAEEIILAQVRDANLASLGTIGAAILLLTSVLALRHLEETLNEIWGIADSRSWLRRLSDYTTVLVVAPLLTGVALSVATTVQSEPVLRSLLGEVAVSTVQDAWITYLPQLFLWMAFSFLYWFFPNTSVRPMAALCGGLIAAILFSVARWAYVDMNVGVARYNAIFGGFAAIPLVLAWLYVCWSVILLGAEVSFAYQNLTHYRREVRGEEPSIAEREAIGLRISLEIARAFREGRGASTPEMLSDHLDLPVRTVRDLVRALRVGRLLEQTGDDTREGGVLPGRPIDDITVSDVFQALRGNREPNNEPETGRADPDAIAEPGEIVVREVMRELDKAMAGVAADRTLADLLAAEPSA